MTARTGGRAATAATGGRAATVSTGGRAASEASDQSRPLNPTPSPASDQSRPLNPTPSPASDQSRPLDLTHAVGVGVDLVDVAAFAEQLAEPGTRFTEAFTAGERRAARSGGTPQREAESLAARWAAKEAVVKAWSSTCFGHPEVIESASVDLREIEVRTDAWGRPSVRLHGAIAESMREYVVLVSLSHDPAAGAGGLAAAFVVLQQEA